VALQKGCYVSISVDWSIRRPINYNIPNENEENAEKAKHMFKSHQQSAKAS
jgi:hypothetical protein